jgi:membrane dipeptidase
VTAGLAAWTAANPIPVATVADVVAHIQHVRDVAGIDHVGIGGDFDGVDALPVGLEGVDDYPRLLAALMAKGWTEADIRKLAGENVLRVMRAVEATAASKRGERPNLAQLPAAGAPE